MLCVLPVALFPGVGYPCDESLLYIYYSQRIDCTPPI